MARYRYYDSVHTANALPSSDRESEKEYLVSRGDADLDANTKAAIPYSRRYIIVILKKYVMFLFVFWFLSACLNSFDFRYNPCSKSSSFSSSSLQNQYHCYHK